MTDDDPPLEHVFPPRDWLEAAQALHIAAAKRAELLKKEEAERQKREAWKKRLASRRQCWYCGWNGSGKNKLVSLDDRNVCQKCRDLLLDGKRPCPDGYIQEDNEKKHGHREVVVNRTYQGEYTLCFDATVRALESIGEEPP